MYDENNKILEVQDVWSEQCYLFFIGVMIYPKRFKEMYLTGLVSSVIAFEKDGIWE